MTRFKKILCVVDPEEAYKVVLERAVSVAENNQAGLTVTAVSEDFGERIEMFPGSRKIELQAALSSKHEERLQSLIEPYRTRWNIQTKLLSGVPFLEIIREVLRTGHDLVIKNAETQSWLGQLFSSDDMHLLRKCPCPVWLIKTGAPTSYKRILAAVDVSENYPPEELETRRALNSLVLEIAVSLALSEFAELHVVCAWYASGESTLRGGFVNMSEDEITAFVQRARAEHSRNFDALMREVSTKFGQDTIDYMKLETYLIKGWARKEIPALARRISADLVVMGTVGRTGIPGFIMGNTAETILNQIDCSVLAVKPPTFVTPVTLQD